MRYIHDPPVGEIDHPQSNHTRSDTYIALPTFSKHDKDFGYLGMQLTLLDERMERQIDREPGFHIFFFFLYCLLHKN